MRALDELTLPTALVGSYAQPDWLIDRAALKSRFPPRTPTPSLWRVEPEYLEEAQNDAVRIAIQDQEEAGLDIITDGEIRRESYSNRFANALDGIDLDNPGEALDRSGHAVAAPRVVGELRRRRPVEVESLKFLRAHTDRPVKMTVPGPFTMQQQAQNDYYPDERSLALAYAEVVRGEIEDLFAAGADVVQLDEPYMQARPEQARAYGLEALNAALQGVRGRTAIHICFGYAALIHERPEGYSFLAELADSLATEISVETAQSDLDPSALEPLRTKGIVLGVIDLSTNEVETPEVVADRIRRALPYIDPKKAVIAPDCGLKYLPREVAFGKMKSLASGAALVRNEIGG